MTARGWAWAVLAAVVVGTLGVVALSPGAERTDADRVDALARSLRCPTCQSESVAESNSETAASIRRDIERRVAAGESDDAIRAAYVDRYSEWVLLDPPVDGLGVLVWAVPVAALLAGAGGIALALRRGARASGRTATAADEEVVRRARGRAAREPEARA